jgi:hypothetical protein
MFVCVYACVWSQNCADWASSFITNLGGDHDIKTNTEKATPYVAAGGVLAAVVVGKLLWDELTKD